MEEKANPRFEIQDGKGGFIVQVLFDGSVVFGPEYSPDTAATTFWNAIANNMPPVKGAYQDAAKVAAGYYPPGTTGHALAEPIAVLLQITAEKVI